MLLNIYLPYICNMYKVLLQGHASNYLIKASCIAELKYKVYNIFPAAYIERSSYFEDWKLYMEVRDYGRIN